MPRNGRNKYPLVADVQWIIKYWRDRAGSLDNKSKQARHKKIKLQTELLEIEKAKQLSELISSKESERMMTHIVVTARGKILGIKAKLAPLLKEFVESSTNFGTLLEQLEETIRDILQDIADSCKI